MDTVKQVEKDFIESTLTREHLVLAQTPQVFRTEVLKEAFARARKDVVERMSGVDFAPMTPEEADAKWQRAEQEVLLETNRAHDWRHRHSPWFRLYYHFF